MKKSATDIIDQYTDNGTLQHGQSQFLGSVTPLRLANNFFIKAEGAITFDNPSQIKVLGVIDGIITIHADNIEDEGKIFEPILFVVEMGSDIRELPPTKTEKTFKEVTIRESSITPDYKIDDVIVVYETKKTETLTIYQYSTRIHDVYPFTEINADKGEVDQSGSGQAYLNYYEEQLPITLGVADPEGMIGWTLIDDVTGEPSENYITTSNQLVLTQEILGQIKEHQEMLFAMFDKKIN